MSTIVSSSMRASPLGGIGDAAAACVAAFLLVSFHAVQGFPTLSSFGGDNDSLMRLVQVRDLIAGQSWFDLAQYRMGPDGFVMHWSRLVDAPIAALVLLGAAVTGQQAGGEAFALVAWPTFLFAASLFLIQRLARLLGGAWAALPALIVGGAALHFLAIFAPGGIDHHNVQLVLALAAIAGLAEGPRGAITAGVCAALMLAIGMETAPYVAVAGAIGALLFLQGSEDGRATAFRYGVAFASTAAVALLATVGPSAWARTACDAYSGAHFLLAAAGGGGLALISATAGRSGAAARVASAAALGVLLVLMASVLLSACFADPYAALDERLRTYWIDHITEAQSFANILAAAPLMALAYYATPVIALVVLAMAIRHDRPRRETVVVFAFLATAVMVSLWQVRGAVFAIPIAVAPLAVWIGIWRRRAESGERLASLRMAGAWLISVNAAWSGAATLLASPSAGVTGTVANACQSGEDYALLAGLPQGTVLSISNLGAPILRYTRHRVLAGSYHRNVEGNTIALDAFMSDPDAAREVAARGKATLIVVCPGNDEARALAEWAPKGLMARLAAGDAPAWLRPVGTFDGPLRIYSIH